MERFFYKDERIFAAWEIKFSSSWDNFYKNDASPDGLSGEREGFYFGRYLVPYLLPAPIEGTFISPDSYPRCLDLNFPPCESCSFFDIEECPLNEDKQNFELSKNGFAEYTRLIYTPRLPRPWKDLQLFDAAKHELDQHGRPLHYKLLAKIISGNTTGEKEQPNNLLKILKNNPIFFINGDDGIFESIPNRRRIDKDYISSRLAYALFGDSLKLVIGSKK
jgi:hypothetical protein